MAEIREKLVEILDKDIDFYEALSTCNIHCAVFSTTLFESIGMGIPTLILGLPGSEHISAIVEYECAKIAKTPEEFIRILQRSKIDIQFLKQWEKDTISNQSFFWEPEPSRKIQRLMFQHYAETP